MPSRSPRSFISDRTIEETYKRTRRHLIGGIVALGCVVLSGILWYKIVEGWTWLDAVYMSVITLATVGFSEVNPLGARGRLFTIILILMGVVVIAYILNCFTEALIQGHLQAGFRLRKRHKLMAALTNHYIICGFGRTGRQVANEFSIEHIPFIIVDSNEYSIQEANLAPSYFGKGQPPHYLRRCCVSPPSSGWVGVGPQRHEAPGKPE
jgi:voltage-gated potassium channel